MTEGVLRWRPKPRETDPTGVVTARYLPNQTGQAYRAMHAALLEVAQMADSSAETTEALFEGRGPVLLVRYLASHDDHPAQVEYVVVQPGNHLYYSQSYDLLGEDTDDSLDHWYVPSD